MLVSSQQAKAAFKQQAAVSSRYLTTPEVQGATFSRYLMTSEQEGAIFSRYFEDCQ